MQDGEVDIEALERALNSGDYNKLAHMQGGGSKKNKEMDELEALVMGMDDDEGGELQKKASNPDPPSKQQRTSQPIQKGPAPPPANEEDELEEFMRTGQVRTGGPDPNAELNKLAPPPVPTRQHQEPQAASNVPARSPPSQPPAPAARQQQPAQSQQPAGGDMLEKMKRTIAEEETFHSISFLSLIHI
eukprot:TRINITY_DN11947_c0_g1_i1.p1 TRINITY_DN11947_c0_g1~~TRINITY_DN11947_c0_g1_i1.p1  ORF type:complete len:188 (-),score=57.09 TRINITY_DN11947_c0_g1_i1:60-623(-)